MVGGISADRTTDAYGEIVIVGGGCYGTYYVRQLARAAAAGAIRWTRLVVVDRDPECAVSRTPPDVPAHTQPAVELVVHEWADFFAEWLPTLDAASRDAIVPSPLMPHLFFEYLASRVKARWPTRAVERVPLSAPVRTPWERASPDGTDYVSHATWVCPTNCIEPHICPHTREVRDWTMPRSLEAYVAERRASGEGLLGPFTFHCTHRAYGVGMVDAAPIVEAERGILRAGGTAAVRALIATASHCHGAAGVLSIAAPG